MTDFSRFPPTELRDFLKAFGWHTLPEGLSDRLYVMENNQFDGRQLVFPMDDDYPDYGDRIGLIFGKFSEIHNKRIDDVVFLAQTAGDDKIALQFQSRRGDDSFLPLNYVVSAVSAAQQMLLSSACTILHPQLHHPRLSRGEAQQFIDNTRFRHTDQGSFVINISSPVFALDLQPPLIEDGDASEPFVRRAIASMQEGVSNLVRAIEDDSLDDYVNRIRSDDRPELSSNLCEALTRFDEEESVDSVVLSVDWAMILPPTNTAVRRVTIKKAYFPRIEEVWREL